MPQLATDKIVELKLPSSKADDQAIVKVNTTLGAKHQLLAADAQGKGLNLATLDLLADVIVDWNFTDEKGQPMPITVDTVGKLHPDDFGAIAEVVLPALEAILSKPNVEAAEKKA